MAMNLTKPVLLAAALALFAVAPSSAAPTIYVDQTASYRYINASSATQQGSPGANWYSVGFDDSGWATGNGVFSSGPPSGTIFENGNQGLPFGGVAQPIPTTFTQWDVEYAPFLRTEFALSAPTDLTVWIAVDNGIGTLSTDSRNGTGANTGMYINGVYSTNIGLVNAEGPALRWENVFNIPASYTVAGENVFALQLEDHGGATGFDMMITSQVGDNNPIFTTAPPPPPPAPSSSTGVPEPITLSLFGAGVAGAIAIRRRKKA